MLGSLAARIEQERSGAWMDKLESCTTVSHNEFSLIDRGVVYKTCSSALTCQALWHLAEISIASAHGRR